MKKLLVFLLATVFTGAAAWAASGKSWSNRSGDSSIYSQDIRADWEEWNPDEAEEGAEGTADSFSNIVTVNGATFNGNIITGQSEYGDAYQNELRLNGGTVNSQNLKAGVSKKQGASENKIVLRNVTVQANVVAGEASTDATDNTVTLENSTVNYNGATQNQVVAGKGYSGEVKNNELYINSGSVLDTTAAAGYSEGTGEVSYNSVTVSGGSTMNDTSGNSAVYGGYSKEGDVYNNQISIKDAAAVAADLYGGYSNSSVSERNLIVVDKADISGNVYGGYTAAGSQAYKNEVRLNGGQAAGTVAGGWAETTGNAEGNKVTVASGVSLGADALTYGGYAVQGDALGNEVLVNAVSAGKEAYGGYSKEGTATGNILSVSGANQGGGVLAGGWAAAGEASGNRLNISGAALAQNAALYGGYGGAGASGNALSVAQSELTGNLYGGYALTGSALGNTLSVSGGSLTGNAYGGYAAEGEASGNTLTLDGVIVSGDVYGGFTSSPSTETATSNNTVVLSGNTVVNGDFYGGNGAVAENNSLVLRNYSGTVKSVNAFDNVTIYGLGSNVTFESDVDNIQVVLYGKPSEISQTLAYTPGNSKLTLNRGVLGAYAYTLESAQQGGQTAWNVKGQYQNELAKPYAQAQLAGLTLAAQGAEMLDRAFDEAVRLNTDNDTFGGVQYYDNSYETGSGFDMQSLVVQGGRWWKSGENVLGLYGQYAHGHYSTDPKDATGDSDGFALGGFALLPYSDEGRFEAVLKAGYQKSDFNSDELSSDLDRDAFYGGLTAGIVQNVSALQLYGKAQWLYLAGDNVHDNLGQSVKFKDVQSLTGRVGARLNLGTLANRYKPYLGISGIYELDGDSNVSVDGHKVSDVDLGGLTGQAEIGVTYENNETLMPMKSSLSVFGLTGQAEGWGANVRLAFSF